MTQNPPSKILLCPVCQNPRQHEFRPFCSIRCKQIDLNRWFSEVYSVSVEEEKNPTIIQDEDLD